MVILTIFQFSAQVLLKTDKYVDICMYVNNPMNLVNRMLSNMQNFGAVSQEQRGVG